MKGSLSRSSLPGVICIAHEGLYMCSYALAEEVDSVYAVSELRAADLSCRIYEYMGIDAIDERTIALGSNEA